jgi:antitoxin MazE
MYIQDAGMQVAKWGDSLAIRLPAELVAELGLAEGDEIEIVSASRARLEVERRKKPPTQAERDAMIERLRALREELKDKVPPGYRFKRSHAYEDD